jgi:hypothetical protein
LSVHVHDVVTAHQHDRYANQKDRNKDSRHDASPFVARFGNA